VGKKLWDYCFFCCNQNIQHMKTTIALFTFISIVLSSCSKGAASKQSDNGSNNPSSSSGSGSNGFNINGIYDTDFGELELKEDQKKVTGTYSYAGNGGVDVKGTLKGDLTDKILSFSWEQTQGEQKSGGNGSFTFSTDAKSYTGTWSDTKGGTGTWNGTKK
jgi:hypothetical protein